MGSCSKHEKILVQFVGMVHKHSSNGKVTSCIWEAECCSVVLVIEKCQVLYERRMD